jgi:hypothetical protein
MEADVEVEELLHAGGAQHLRCLELLVQVLELEQVGIGRMAGDGGGGIAFQQASVT